MKRKRDMIDFTGDIIHVKCGGSDKLTHIHRSLLEKMIGPLEVGEMVLGDFDPITNKLDLSALAQHDGFQLVAQWLYTGKIGLVDEAFEPVAAVTMLQNAYDATLRLVGDWGDQDWSCLLNNIMDHMIDRITNPEKYGAAIAVEDLLKIPRMRCGYANRFFSMWLVYGDLTSILRPEQLDLLFDNRSKGPQKRTLLENRLEGSDTPPWKKDPCAFHVHSDESMRCQARTSTARVSTDESVKSEQAD
ncbi:hypothetical protein D0869_13476 [Hortaea werneckii]|uniref:BTB domain-containing protein n=1 Tax=Hortaea werneckii TaxID=91943 RepID=A0A3M6XNY7_HORWE|nr:hypothetical protein KC334_g7019 [Hortaea werneckii]KAI6954030.1 hypothetical protein KC355_g13642 [Hortaea werneckii]KAI7175596.1 hypothetical protein KC324_g10045 [Hortaea werneckii]KAI7536605.1 hypothetical protein KC316_g16095 [Hortaea werneckii]KAI7656201.1 hypothetical protein KC318_g12552 [Hortaea werneckii]